MGYGCGGISGGGGERDILIGGAQASRTCKVAKYGVCRHGPYYPWVVHRVDSKESVANRHHALPEGDVINSSHTRPRRAYQQRLFVFIFLPPRRISLIITICSLSAAFLTAPTPRRIYNMTAYHDPQSIEARKARYSQELAAYTLRQWDLVRQAMEQGDRNEGSGSPSPRRQNSSSGSRETEASARLRQGTQNSLCPMECLNS